MVVPFNLLYTYLLRSNVYAPLAYLDLFIAITLVVSFLVYLHRFPAFRVVIGTFFLVCCSLIFLLTGFLFTALVFGLASLLIGLSLPLIFAPEVRHYLEKLGHFPFLRIPRITHKQKIAILIHNLTDAVYEMAERNIGASIVIARHTGLGETLDTGTIIDARFSSKLLQNIFFPKSPLHDGAVIIRGDRIYAAGCLLPIHSEIRLDPPFGTRHKSGLAITTDTDAVVILISEQRGEVTLAENGKLDINLNRIQLKSRLHQLM